MAIVKNYFVIVGRMGQHPIACWLPTLDGSEARERICEGFGPADLSSGNAELESDLLRREQCWSTRLQLSRAKLNVSATMKG